ncbi:hypothetical protein [Streptomyces mirabilis]|uniref:hypothetical protein n=1 Tax=Streptomyces mirabilis TaxID=68239 RepID=UPI00364F8AAD
MPMRPVSTDDVAAALAHVAVGVPLFGVPTRTPTWGVLREHNETFWTWPDPARR